MSELQAGQNRAEPLKPERFEALLAAYGANPAHWPQDERAQVEAFVHANANYEPMLREADAVDRALDAVSEASFSTALSARILDGFDRISSRPSVRRFINVAANFVWPGAPLWQPSAALAASLMVGLMLGVMLPLGSRAQNVHTTDVSVAFSPADSDNDGEP